MLPLLGAGRMAMQALPYITALMGAAPGLKKGNLGEAVIGGGLGYLGGGLGAGGIQKGARAGAAYFRPAAAAMAGTPLGQQASILKRVAQLGIPLAGAAAATPLIGGLAGAVAQPIAGLAGSVGNTALGAVGLGQAATRQPGALTSPIYPEGSVPDISGYQYPGMISQQNPLGLGKLTLHTKSNFKILKIKTS
jgi:hypothetical protein